MGQAKKRGTFEERKTQAKVREEEEWKKRTEEWNKRNPPRVTPTGPDVISMIASAMGSSLERRMILGRRGAY